MARPLYLSGGYTIFSTPSLGLLITVGFLLLTLLSVSVAAEEGAIELTVQPSLCILGDGESLCRDQVKINWRAPREHSLCLYQTGASAPLDCWQQTRVGSYTQVLETENDVQFQLVEQNGQQVVARYVFEVIADAKRYRRQRRNPWSFF